MRYIMLMSALIVALPGCERDNPKHLVKEMVGTYSGTWMFVRNNGNTYENGELEVYQGSSKKTIYVGPEMTEFELSENLDPIILGNSFRLSFPDGNTNKIMFERYWDSPYKDEFIGTKATSN
jgi:hypothetical protein